MTAKTISFKHGDEKWKKLRHRAETDLFWFNSVVLGLADKFKLREDTHGVIHHVMQRNTGVKEIDEALMQLLMWPRETGKSACGCIGYSAWMGCKYPNIAILIANEKEETAKDFVRSIEWHFENNALLRALFPEVIPPDFNKVEWSATRATLNRTTGRPEATFDCTGVGGTKVGKHYDIIICDDLITKTGMESALRGNPSITKETNRWVNQLQPMLSFAAKDTIGPGFPFIRFIGTHWFHNDTYEYIKKAFAYEDKPVRYRISKTLRTGKKVSRVVECVGDLAILTVAGIENGKPTFPKIWPQERMDNLRMVDPVLFACNIMNDPGHADIRTFQDAWLRYWKFTDHSGTTIQYRQDDGEIRQVLVSSLIRLAVTDPAFSSNSDGSRAAVVILGVDVPTAKMILLDVTAERKDPFDNLEDYLNLIVKWGVRRAYVELAGQQKAYLQWLQTEARRRSIPVIIEDVKPGGRNKDVRIEGLMVPWKNGDIYIHASQSVLIDDEYKKWRPGSEMADVLDALAYAVEEAPKPTIRARSDVQAEKQKQLNSYYRRRNMSTAGVR